MKTLALNATNQSIKAVMSAAITTTAPAFVCTYSDSTSSAFTEAPQNGVLNGTTEVTIVSSPASATRRLVSEIIIFNNDSVNITITLFFVDGANSRKIAQEIIEPNGHRTMQGVFDANGNLKTAVPFVAASALSGQVALTNGGTGVDNTSRTANTVFAGPGSGGAGNASFRALLTADIPTTLDAKSFAGVSDFSAGSLLLPSGAPGAEGRIGWDATNKGLRIHDSQRSRIPHPLGWTMLAYPPCFDNSLALAVSFTMPAQWNTVLTPIYVPAPMLLQAVMVRNNDTSLARTWGWDLYQQRLNNGNSSENTLDRVASSSANETFTAAAASDRTISAASAPVELAPGVYMLAIQNRHASNGFFLAGYTVTFAPNFTRLKTTGGTNGATLDVVTGWTKSGSVPACVLVGRVFGETAGY